MVYFQGNIQPRKTMTYQIENSFSIPTRSYIENLEKIKCMPHRNQPTEVSIEKQMLQLAVRTGGPYRLILEAIVLWKKSAIAILVPFVNCIIIFLILSSVRNVGSFVIIEKSKRELSNLLTTCNVRMENYIRMVSDCFDVTVENGVIRGRITCQCHKCTRKWRHDADHCGPRKAHVLACRFGGPRWGNNCWHNTIEQEFWWTAQEERLALNLPADVILDTHAVLYCVANDCKYFNESTSHRSFVKKRKSLMRLTLQRLKF